MYGSDPISTLICTLQVLSLLLRHDSRVTTCYAQLHIAYRRMHHCMTAAVRTVAGAGPFRVNFRPERTWASFVPSRQALGDKFGSRSLSLHLREERLERHNSSSSFCITRVIVRSGGYHSIGSTQDGQTKQLTQKDRLTRSSSLSSTEGSCCGPLLLAHLCNL